MTRVSIIQSAIFIACTTASAFAQHDADELAKQLQNPVSSLISVPFQFNYDDRIGPLDEGWQFKLNFQPVIPVSLNDNWNVIIRTIVPYIVQEDVFTGTTPDFPIDRKTGKTSP